MAGVISLCIYITFSSHIPLSLVTWDHSSALGNSALGSFPQLSFSGIDSTVQFWGTVFWDRLHSSALWYSVLGATPQLNFGEE